MSEKKNNLAELFELAITIEKTAEALYQGLEAMFAHEEEVAWFWSKLAGEEDQHASQLRTLCRSLTPEQLAAPADAKMLQNAHKMLAFSVESSLEKIYDLEDAYQLAHEMESSEANAIFDFLVTHFAQDQRSQDLLREQLRGHILTIENAFPVQYRGASGRRKVIARPPDTP